MRDTMRGLIALAIVAFLFSMLHSCSLDNHILKPSCVVFEVDIVEKWWMPKESGEQRVFFGSNGYMKMDGISDSVTFSIENCNKIMVTNLSANTMEQWVIKYITDKDLHITFPDGRAVEYERTN